MIQCEFINYLLDTQDSSLITTNGITEEYFPTFKNEFRFIKQHLDTYGVLPAKATFFGKFTDFEQLDVKESVDYLLRTLRRNYYFTQVGEVYRQIQQAVVTENDGEVKRLTALAAEIQNLSSTVEAVDILRDISRYDAYVERCDNFDKYYVKTGFPELDEIIGGWDREEELATIVARSNMGKSWLLLKSAVAALEQGLKVGVYSGEMSERKVGYRVDTLIAHLSNVAITKGNRDVQNDYYRYIHDLGNRYSSFLKVLTPIQLGKTAGVSDLRSFIEKDDLDILFIDQHSLLEDDRKARTPVEKASNISRDLKNLQVLKKIPIIADSQQNRASTEDGVGLEHIAQADRIGQDSTVVLFFEQKDGVGTIHLVKSRDSENNKSLTYLVDFNRGNFTFVPEGAEAEASEAPQFTPEVKPGEEEVSWT